MTFLEISEIQRIGDAIGLKGNFLVDWGTDDILDTIAPIPRPQAETRGVKRWAVFSADGRIFKESWPITIRPDETYMSENWPGCVLIELTGTITVPVKRKRKRREELPRDSFRAGYQSLHPTAKFFAEWTEDAE